MLSLRLSNDLPDSSVNMHSFSLQQLQTPSVEAQVFTGPPVPSDGPRMTTRYMTKYERARILGTRALQIRCGFRVALCCN